MLIVERKETAHTEKGRNFSAGLCLRTSSPYSVCDFSITDAVYMFIYVLHV